MYFRLESPTRSLVMEAPKGVEINAEAGNMEATCRTELRLESKDGEVGVRRTQVRTDSAKEPASPTTFPHSLSTEAEPIFLTRGASQKVLCSQQIC